MDEGFIRDNRGNLVNVNNLIVMTTNVGYEKGRVGFDGDKERGNECDSELRRVFGDAFMNRIDGVIYFDSLEREDVMVIAKREIEGILKENKWLEEYRERFMDEEFIAGIVRDSDFTEYGARKVKRLVSERMESVIVDKMDSIGKEEMDKMAIKREVTSN